jgi:hypothetical protein
MSYRISGIQIPVTPADAARLEAWLNQIHSEGGVLLAGLPGPRPGTAVLVFDDGGSGFAAMTDEVFRGDNLASPSDP